jgi:LemA protein
MRNSVYADVVTLPATPVDPAWIAAAIALAGPAAGMLMLRGHASQDHRTWVLARAPRLPVGTLAVGDDAWLRGKVVPQQVLHCPEFDVACVSFAYKRERLHRWTTKDKDGKVQHHSEWRTEHSEAECVDWWLDDGDRILVRARGAEDEARSSLGTRYTSSSLRHSASVLEVGAEVSVLGVKLDDGSFGAAAEVPCLWSLQQREKRLRQSEHGEWWWFFGACLVAFAGGAAAAGFWLLQVAQERFSIQVASAMVGLGMLTWMPVWWIGAWNRLVRLRQQVQAAFRQVDVDLSVRAALVPNLIAVVQAGAAHEAELLRRLAAIRSGQAADEAVEGERSACAATRGVLRLHERYPQLQQQDLYLDLHDRLWAVEEKLAHTRQLYNGIATEWNNRLQRFPEALVAVVMRCHPAPWFAGLDDDAVPPRLRR